jgi:hypothetical protein
MRLLLRNYPARIPAAALLLPATLILTSSAARAQVPVIQYVFPAGAQRGTTVETTVTGTDLQGATGVRFAPGDITGRVVRVVNPTTVVISIQADPGAELGEHDLRLLTPRGASNRYRFMVGPLPEVNEIQPNSNRSKAQRLSSLPILVNGQILESQRDYYRFTVQAGETLVCEIQARALLPYIANAVPGWLDACLTLYDARGTELASVDDFRLDPDPVLIYKVPAPGEYLLEVRDILDRGRGDFVYRLSIGALPRIIGIVPMGGKRGATTHVALNGVNLPAQFLDLAIPGDSPARREVEVKANGLASNRVPFAVGDVPEAEEKEPNDSPASASRMMPPVAINGRIDRQGDADCFSFQARAGQTLVMEVQARRLGSPVDSLLALFDAQGRKLAENDDTVDPEMPLLTHHADSRLAYTFPADGDYFLRILDAQGKGGEDYTYRLIIAPPRPGFILRVTPDNPRVARGGSVALTVTATRQDGFDGEIALAIQNLPPGFAASDAVIARGQNSAPLTITAPREAGSLVFAPTIVGSGMIGGARITRTAEAMETVMQAFSYTMNPTCREIVVTVGEGGSLSLSPSPGPRLNAILAGTANVFGHLLARIRASQATGQPPHCSIVSSMVTIRRRVSDSAAITCW